MEPPNLPIPNDKDFPQDIVTTNILSGLDLSASGLTNFQKWHIYCSHLVSPESYVSFGYFYMVAAALQRRVWLPPTNSPLFLNQYSILTGSAALGKGMTIKEVAKVLRHYKMAKPNGEVKEVKVSGAATTNGSLTPEDIAIIENAREVNFQRAENEENQYGVEVEKGKKRISLDAPLKIPLAADDTTYEALVKSLAKSLRYKDYPKWSEKQNKHIAGIYQHSSLAFNLEEISSLFEKNREKVCKLMLNTYDCGDYTYDTKTQGKDRIRNCCLNFFGGTTPSFIEEVFSSKLLSDGFSSRTWFIFESENRDNSFFLKQWSPFQMQCHQDVLEHVGKLLELYGEIKYTEGVQDWLENWWRENKNKRANRSTKLDDYYGRKKAHILKLAGAIHFGESTDMVLGLRPIQTAIKFLEMIEVKMHHALTFGEGNKLHKAMRHIVKILKRNGRQTRNALFIETFPLLEKKADFEEVMEILLETKKIRDVKQDSTLPGQVKIFYEINEGEMEA